MYAQEIEESGDSASRTAQEIAQSAGISSNYGTEIDKGRVLSEYVQVRDGSVLKWRA